ncbi:MAG: hypothetical protein ACK2UQ_11670 [Anaerolineae bacterium]
MASTQDREGFKSRVKDNLQKAKTLTANLRKSNSRLLVSSIVTSGASALVAGITAAQGPIVGEGIPGWRIACTVAAVLAFAAAVCTGLVQQLKISERLAEGNQCFGRLNALDVAMVMGNRNWEELTKEYEEIVKTYPEFV